MSNWDNNAIQFPRLIAEIESVGGFSPLLIRQLREAMDLEHEDLLELIERAVVEWDRIKGET